MFKVEAELAEEAKLPLIGIHIGRLPNMSGQPHGFWFMWRPRDAVRDEKTVAYSHPKRTPFGFGMAFYKPFSFFRLG